MLSVLSLPQDNKKGRITAVGIAVFHSSINLVFSMIMLPFAGVLVKLAVRTIPYTEQEMLEQKETLQYLDPLLFRNPGLAAAQARKAIGAVSESIQDSFSAWLGGHCEEAEQCCRRTQRYISQTESYMTNLTKKQLLEDVSREIHFLQKICGDYTTISRQISTLAQNREAADALSSAAQADLRVYGEAVRETLDIVAEGFESGSSQLAGTVQDFREVIDSLFHKINARQISRIHSGESGSESGVPFIEICFAYERIMDRCDHIAGTLLDFVSAAPRPLNPKSQEEQEQRYRQIRALFRDKYSMLR